MRKRVLHIINSLGFGGAEMLLVNSLSPGGLQEHTQNFVAYFQGTSELEKRIDERVPVVCLNYSGIKSLPATLKKLKHLIRDLKIDIVHSHLNPAGVYTHLVCTVPQVHTLHTTYSMDKETTPLRLKIERRLYLTKKDCNLILLSEYTKADLLRSISFKGKTFVLNNFVSDSYFKEQAKNYTAVKKSLRIVAAGRLNPGKNLEYIIDVFKYLKGYNIQLDIYGTGNIAAYNVLIKKLGVNVRMMGHSDDLANVVPRYDLFVMPSKFEGFPLSVFEAMAAGVPLLLSDIAPVKSIVQEHAIYFSLNDPHHVSEIILSIFEGRIDINHMAMNALLFAEEKVKRETYITRLLAIYQTLERER